MLNDANWAQSTINSTETFTLKDKLTGITHYTDRFGIEINTVDDLANAIKNGTIKADDIIVDYVINENGTKLILNTRTSVALERAGIPKDQWVGRDQTGNKVPNMGDTTFDELAQRQLNNNNLPLDGTSTPPLGSQ